MTGEGKRMGETGIARRSVLGGSLALLLATRAGAAHDDLGLRDAIAACERGSGGRLGVAMLDSAHGRRFAWRGDERFPLCSTFKLLLAAAVLHRVDAGAETLARTLPVAPADLVANSPFTERLVGQRVAIGDLCRATMTLSDNAAANILLPLIGGPPGITRFARSLGDRMTRLDRIETALGECTPGDPRDTTTPRAMLHTLDRLLLGRVLTPAARALLLGWLADNRTGAGRLVAGLPAGWRIGDKTGGGEHGTTNDIAILWPPARPPILIASYLTQTDADPATRNATHAAVARAIVAAVTT